MALNTKYYLPGKRANISNQYDCQWTLSLNGETARVYYSFTNPNVTGICRGQILKAVENELSECTLYSTSMSTQNFNCIITTPDTNDAQYAKAVLTNVKYPAGNELKIGFSNKGYTRYNIIGYTVQSQISSISETYRIKSLDYYFYLDQINFSIGDYTGYYNFIEKNGTYSSTAEYIRTRQVIPTKTNPNLTPGRYIMTNKKVLYTYNRNGLLVAQEERPCVTIQDHEIKNFTDFSEKCNNNPIGTQRKTAYTYNDGNLPTKISTQYFNLPGSSVSRTKSYQYTYDKKGNPLTKTQPNGQAVTYTYNGNYSIPLTKTYRQNGSTTLVETNTLTSDRKSIAATTVTSNGNTVARSEFTYNIKGQVINQKTYSDALHFTEQQFAYGDGAQITETKVLDVKDATGVLVFGTPGYSAGVITQKSGYNARGWQTSQTDGNGNQTSIGYDATGRVTKVTQPDGG